MAYHSESLASQPSDTYFVESDDHRSSTSAKARDFAAMIALQRQEAMACELSRQASEDYVDDIKAHMSQMEDETLPDVASIDIQEEIQWFMRPYLLDFLIEAHAAFQLLPETLFLSINLLDRYCSRRVVYKKHYQLVGCASLLIAAKYGDRKDRVPTIRELKSMCCSLYDEDMFTQMEWHVLNTLDWAVGHPTVDSFIQIELAEIALTEEIEDLEVQHMAWYICEIALYHKEFVSTRPSVMARASLAIARGVMGRPEPADLQLPHAENLVVVGLTQQLFRPSQVLARKYYSAHLSRAAVTLENFLNEQAAIARRRNITPPTPPCITVEKTMQDTNIYSTPQKPHLGVNVNGYMTPPITPEGEYFQGGNQANGYAAHPPRRPYTPSPMSNDPYQPSSYSYQQDNLMY